MNVGGAESVLEKATQAREGELRRWPSSPPGSSPRRRCSSKRRWRRSSSARAPETPRSLRATLRSSGSVVPGLVRFVRADGDEQRVAAHGGFIHVEANGRVTVLPPVAELAEDDRPRSRAQPSSRARRPGCRSSRRRVARQETSRDDSSSAIDVEVEAAEGDEKACGGPNRGGGR